MIKESSPLNEQLLVRLDAESKQLIGRAAKSRKISVSDYVRQVMVGQARREVIQSDENTIVLTSDEQLAFWTALNEPRELTEAQKKLGAIMRGTA